MKVLIWVLCFLVESIITVFLDDIGIVLGAIPTGLLAFATISLAIFLCRKWDEHKQTKVAQTDKLPTNNQNVENRTQAETSHFNNFTVCIYDTVNQKIRKEERTIDTKKFPLERYAVNGIYYAIEKMNNGKKVRVYCSKSSWQNHLDSQIANKSKIKFCRKCGFELISESEYCHKCGTKIVINMEMKCYNCEQLLPEDSEFCQCCGKKIETKISIQETSTLKNALDAIIKIQSEETVSRLKENMQNQPNNEGDVDFGLVPEKPIYTLALMSVDGEVEYLNRLYTESGIKIKWTRRGSTSANGINGMIDIYDTCLPSGEPYKTIYINMYGAKKSEKAPVGFTLENIETRREQINYKETRKVKTKFCKLCGNEIDVETKKCKGCGKQYFKEFKINKFAIILLIIAFVLFINKDYIIDNFVYNANITQDEINLKIDDTYKIRYDINFDSASSKIKWESSNPSIVGVSSQGTITAKNEGSAKIKLLINDVLKDSCIVNVSLEPVFVQNGEMIISPQRQGSPEVTVNSPQESNCYVYLKNVYNEKNDVSFYVGAGQSVTVNVPAGTYELYYATGETWYGEKYKFGKETNYSKADEYTTLSESYSSYDIVEFTLYAVPNGNMHTENIDESEFPS